MTAMPAIQFKKTTNVPTGAGVWLPRSAEDGSSLPSARLVSISVIPDIDSPDAHHALWVMQYGQFVDHDLTSTPVFRMGRHRFHLSEKMGNAQVKYALN